MKNKLHIIFFLLCLLATDSIFSQNSYVNDTPKDSLVRERIMHLNQQAFDLAANNFEESRALAEEALELAIDFGDSKLIARSYNRLGVIYYYFTAYDKALEYYYKALKINEENEDSLAIAKDLNNIGLVYSEINSFDNALDHYKRSLEINIKYNNYNSIANNYNNLGIVYRHKNKVDSALFFYRKAVKLNEKEESIRSLAINYNNIGNIYADIGDQVKALEAFKTSLHFNKSIDHAYGQTRNYINLAEIGLEENNPDMARQYLDTAGLYIQGLKARDLYIEYYKVAIALAKSLGDREHLPELYEKYIAITDSLNNVELSNRLQKQHTLHEISKKNAEIDVLRAKNDLQEAKLQKQRQFRILFLLILVLLFIILVLVVNRYRTKAKMSKELELKVKKRTQDLAVAKEKAELSDRLKTSFLANMSHEIRTPMNAIVGFSSILGREGIPAEEKKAYQKHVSEQSKYLLRLLNDIMDASKIESGDFKLRKISFNLKNVIHRLQEEYEQRIHESQKPVKLKIKACDNLTDQIFFDSGRLYQVLDNLLDNALKFTEEGEILLEYRLEEGDPQSIFFRVRDTGIGIPAENQEIIFQRFRQLDESATRRYGGTGIGLAVCKGILQVAGCDLNVKSSPGEGAEFSFSIPYNPDTSDELKDVSSYSNSFKGKSILIVEDDKLVCEYITKVLGETGADLKFASNGRKALQMVKKKNGIDLILMDIRMPEMNGYEAARAIKDLRTDIPIIAQTAFVFSHDEETSLQNGYDDYLPKPIRPKNLMHMLNKYLS